MHFDGKTTLFYHIWQHCFNMCVTLATLLPKQRWHDKKSIVWYLKNVFNCTNTVVELINPVACEYQKLIKIHVRARMDFYELN